MDIKQIVLKYLELGFNVLPYMENNKFAVKRWKPYQEKMFDWFLLFKYMTNNVVLIDKPDFEKYKDIFQERWFEIEGLCVVCGKVSQNLLVIDFDDINYYNNIKDYLIPTLAVHTPSGGVHLYYRLSNQVLQKYEVISKTKTAETATKGESVSIRWNGHLANIYPTKKFINYEYKTYEFYYNNKKIDVFDLNKDMIKVLSADEYKSLMLILGVAPKLKNKNISITNPFLKQKFKKQCKTSGKEFDANAVFEILQKYYIPGNRHFVIFYTFRMLNTYKFSLESQLQLFNLFLQKDNSEYTARLYTFVQCLFMNYDEKTISMIGLENISKAIEYAKTKNTYLLKFDTFCNKLNISKEDSNKLFHLLFNK